MGIIRPGRKQESGEGRLRMVIAIILCLESWSVAKISHPAHAGLCFTVEEKLVFQHLYPLDLNCKL